MQGVIPRSSLWLLLLGCMLLIPPSHAQQWVHDLLDRPESVLHNDTGNNVNDTHHGIQVASWKLDYVGPYLIVTLFLMAVAISKLGFHKAHFLSTIVPESCLLIILGTIVGVIHFCLSADNTQFHLTTEMFFLILLPPIILESAYSLHDRDFFNNLGTILLYAVIGTIFNCFLLGFTLYGMAVVGGMGSLSITLLECLVFSSLIVAVDPVAVLAIFQEIGVNNVLYFLVFGESLLNDAVTVVIYNTMTAFNDMKTIPGEQIALAFAAFFTVSLCGLSIGIIIGIISSFITKYTYDVRVIEPLVIFIFAYGSYIMAELFHFSGIISIIGCGLIQAQYAFHNISLKSLTTVTYFSKSISSTCDCLIFMFLGLELVKSNHEWDTGFVLWTLFLCLVIRFIGVYALTFLANKIGRVRKVDMEEQFIMAYGGLRGAVAFSLAAMLNTDMHHKELFVTTTLIVILFTVFVQGITIKPLVKLLRIRRTGKEEVSMYQEINIHMTDHLMAGIEEIAGNRGHNFIREWCHKQDNKYLKKLLLRNPHSREKSIMEIHNKMIMQLHYENLPGVNLSDSYERGSILNLYVNPACVNPARVISFHDEDSMDEDSFLASLSEVSKAKEDIYASIRRYPKSRTLPQVSTSQPKHRPISEQVRPSITSQRDFEAIGNDQEAFFHRRSFIEALKNRVSSTEVPAEINPHSLHSIFLKNPQIYRHQQDRSHEDEDFLHLLYEKRRRTLRMHHASLLSRESSLTSEQEERPMTPIIKVEENKPPRHKSYYQTARRHTARRSKPIKVDEREKVIKAHTASDKTGTQVDINKNTPPSSEVLPMLSTDGAGRDNASYGGGGSTLV